MTFAIKASTSSKLNTKRRRWLYSLMHVIVLLLSIFLVVTISIDTFHNVAFWKQPEFMRVQFWICIIFLLDFFVEFFLAEKKWRYLLTHIFFFIVSIPYLAIFHYFGWKFSPQVTYLVQYIPLVRGGYALAIVVGWFSYNRATGLFFTYLFTLFATVFFGSLVFFMFERNVNLLVVDYYSALWWACMDVTTVGSNIEAVTPVGRVLSVCLAAMGMMMFPIFTVYITNIIQRHNQIGSEGEGDFVNNPSNMDADDLKQIQSVAAEAKAAADEAKAADADAKAKDDDAAAKDADAKEKDDDAAAKDADAKAKDDDAAAKDADATAKDDDATQKANSIQK
ncbi:MAG: two pore domain potassium channel family protein [Muribaculaceae bacterium]|nr:two pore domain potassium channel family protein [Muribaculaceae bacterium]